MWLYKQYLQIRPTHFYHRDAVLYPSIPKNSSTIWRNRVFNTKHSKVNIHNLPKINYAFAVIRNPAERLISGLQEWIKRSKRTETVEQIIDNFNHYAEWDHSVNDLNFYAHIMPQTYFTSEYDFELFEFHNQNSIATHLDKHNIAPKVSDSIKKYINTPYKTYELVDDPRTIKIIQQYYAKDFDIWKNI